MSPRRMEEASVAGESPDKSEQQKSSGTARSERDPRLAVFREPASPAESGGRADTATAVFRTQRAGAEAESESTADAGPGAAEEPATRESEGATAAEEAPEAPEGSVEAPGAAPGAAEPAEPPEEPEEPTEGVEPAEAVPVAEAGAADQGGATDSAGAADSAEEPENAASGDTGSEPEGEASEAPEEGDARLRAAVAAWVSTADGDQAEEGDGDEKSTDAEGTRPGGEEVPTAADAAEPAAPATGADDHPDLTETESEPEPVSESEPVSEPEAAEAATSGEARVPRTREESGPAASEAAAAAGKSVAAKPAAEVASEAGDQRGIDQPTAVFKAPSLPRVDQPTTALKITPPPAKPKPGSEPGAAPQSGPDSGRQTKPESPAERTSKFVPLRADDVRPAPVPRRPEADPAPEPGRSAQQQQQQQQRQQQQQPAASLSGAERTRQQPMPPRPPLDLLAELTNTPPPPETPVRTAVRRVKIWTPLVLLLLIAFAIVQMVRPLPDPTLTMSAKSTYSFKGAAPSLPWPEKGQGYMAATGLGKVGSFGEQKPVPIASVAKAMTAYLVLKDHPLKRGQKGPGIPVDAKAESDGQLFSEGESTLDTVKKGDVLSERDALAALMIPSANNIARLLARWDAGSEKAFVEKMNATADELGMKNTNYTDPSGLTASTVSTAEDLVKLGEKLVEFPALMDITKLPEWKDPSGKKWRNYNTLVPYDNALGIKTGSTTKAGGNLLFAAHKMVDGTDQLIVGAVLGQYDTPIIDAVNAASKKVMLATLDLLEGAKIVKKGDVVGTVDDGMGGTAPVVATKDVKAVGWSGLTVKLELTDDGKTIPHAAAAGTHVGTLTVGEGASQVKVPVALQSDLAEPTAGEKLTRVG
ncbi:serine hydrolase [Streptomyces sp. RKAG290]|uniref:serine hydrolase n=1 Tax=Streptomyces sp. RKAG290 TaxID=2888348 RepID=UPI0020337C89|nr:serine hydrolase [Streptomyces sp. RKAG290]MCM2413540.1 hypothetical protein [Streptomyces sp. RKAG290]